MWLLQQGHGPQALKLLEDPLDGVCEHFCKTFGEVPQKRLLKKLICHGLRRKVHTPEK